MHSQPLQEITLWRKGERTRKGIGGPMSAANSVYQIPHAMARHEGGGDVPSANIRTAPTPSEPNTPAAVAVPVDGASAVPIPGPAGFHGGISTIGEPVAPNEEIRESEREDDSPEEIPQAEPEVPGNESETVVSTPSTTEKDAPEPEPVPEPVPEPAKEEAQPPPSKEPAPPVEQPVEVDEVAEKMAEAKVSEGAQNDTASPAPPSPVASPDSPHKFMESPPPMEDSVGGGADEDSAEEIDGVSDDQSEEELVEEPVKAKTKKKQPEAVAT